MKFIKLTNAKGEAVLVQASWIQFVELPMTDDRLYSKEIKAVLVLSGARLGVMETVERVAALVDEQAAL